MIERDLPMVISRPHYISSRECGYCHGKKTNFQALKSMESKADPTKPSQSVTIGASVEQMTCKHYDEMINQGFRRSGTFLYKPDLLRGCCRLYTIRTDMDHLKVVKLHRQTINRFMRAIQDSGAAKDGTDKKAAFSLEALIRAEQSSSRFRTSFEKSVFTKEKYELYKKYQIKVHNDDPLEISERSFKRFLCDTPFTDEEVDGDNEQWLHLNKWVKNWSSGTVSSENRKNRRMGPTHECYYIDDKLIAVSVMDFLPTGVSSIYFIWDPDFAHLSLGTLSGLREIQMCKELELGYYYLGYYIEDCPKMKYKAKFGGEVLDLCNEVYFPLEKVNHFMEGGRLFVVGEKSQIAEAGEEGLDELELENTGHPIRFEESDFCGAELFNISEQVYGGDHIYSRATAAQEALDKLLKYKKLWFLANDPYLMPLVVPGVTPVWQILEWFENGVLDDQLEVSMFMVAASEMKEVQFGQLNTTGKKVVIDSIRLFGLEKVQDSILLV